MLIMLIQKEKIRIFCMGQCSIFFDSHKFTYNEGRPIWLLRRYRILSLDDCPFI